MEIEKTQKPKVVSLFTGCGGLDLGFKQAGYQTVWANDIDHWACETFKRNISPNIVEKSIELIDPYKKNEIPDCDIILGGFPCQDFSIIWKQPGLDGERGNLYKSFLKFVDAKKPKAFVAENVKGLLTANNKKAIEQIIVDFENIKPGYIVFPKLYNFAEYGVPQFRERVLLVGIRVDTNFNFKHPEATYGPNKLPYVTCGDAFVNVEKVEYNNEHQRILPTTRKLLELIPEGGNFTDIPIDHELYVKGLISHVYRRINRNEPSKTIIAAGGGGTWGYHYPEPRPLTNRERARLQTFPDNFIFEGSIGEVRRQIGNAVPPLGVVLLAKSIYSLFTKKYDTIDLMKYKKYLSELTVHKRLESIADQAYFNKAS